MKKYSWVLLFLAFLGIFAARNFLFPFFVDDYAYAFKWNEKYGNLMDYDKMPDEVPNFERIESISDIVKSQYTHYMNWGARPIGLGLNQFFMMYDKKFFNIANTLAFAALILLMYSLSQKAQGLKDISFGRLLWLIFAIWFCLPEFAVTMLWECGACVYLFMTVIQCAFLIPYAKRYNDKNYNFSLPLIIIFGFLSGCTNEGGGVGLFFITLIFLIRSRMRRENIKFMLAGFLAFCAGFAFIILAPGNVNRIELTKKFLSYDLAFAPEEMYTAVMYFMNFIEGFLLIMLAQLPAYAVILVYLRQNRKSKDDLYGYVLTFSFAAFMVPCACMFSPEFSPRAAFASSIFIIIASCSAISKIKMPGRKFLFSIGILGALIFGLSFVYPDKIYITSTSKILMVTLFIAFVKNLMSEKKIMNVLKIAAVMFLVFDMSICLAHDIDIYKQSNERLVLIEQQKGKDLIEVPKLKMIDLPYYTELRAFDDEYILLNCDLLESPYNHCNIVFAAYYNLKQIKSK